MRKKRVLVITEATYLNTGYSTYSKQVINRLHESGKYEIAEFSIYGSADDPRRKSIKWKNYPNMPDPNNKDQVAAYNSNPINQFGAWRFERVCLDFEPDACLMIRDYWMDSFVYHSPFRNRFSTIWMPTVDASRQNSEWIDVFANMDYVLTYSDWAQNLLREQGGSSINLQGVASPCAPPAYVPMNKIECRRELGIPEDAKIIGTVMRNQRRKLFPALFEAFGKYLKQTGDINTYLYCHTSFPDAGWNLAELLHENEISSRVLFSYVCENCKALEVCHFNDARKQCLNCQKFSSTPSSVANGLEDTTLAKVYNSFDLYIQLANSEGFGVPAIEACSCGIPLAVTNYSAMEDFVQKLDAYPINCSTYKELETGCDRAVPYIDNIVDIFTNFFSLTPEQRAEKSRNTRKLYEECYSWENTVSSWSKCIDDCPYANWSGASEAKPIIDIRIDQPSNGEFMRDLINAYIYNPDHRDSYFTRNILRDLNRGMTKVAFDGYYQSEFSPYASDKHRPFNREMIKKSLMDRLNNYNIWEVARADRSKLIDGKEKWLN